MMIATEENTMNRERLAKLADTIEAGREDLGFNMQEWVGEHGCGTTACIAGWTCAVFAPKDWEEMIRLGTGGYMRAHSERGTVGEVAAEELGFAIASDARLLFIPDNWFHASAEKAVRVLRHAALTGTIDWSI